MPYCATIPQVTFHPYPTYSASPRSPVETTFYAPYDELAAIKVQLRRLLKQNSVARLPAGFPFQCVPDAYGCQSMSQASYDFHEYLHLPNRCSKSHYVTFKYIAPSARTGSEEMEWRVVVPDRQPLRNSNVPVIATIISQVKVDSRIMETSFGFQFMTNSRIIQEALALSLELGILITIQIANHKTEMMYPSRRGIYFSPGEIIFLATDNFGRSEVVFVYQP
ncbi:hypothetical protein BDN70DRAFT_898394 [Pholiota conissans]|uniref:Uncharacterized protein n=1 Tax=Pholiota conissans TaxID=109636 RepID=A0A9P5YU24_9AGAR|nr:hypothetical protein BDN70DRAFT_898394 [Pholiota conissans]